MRAITIAIDGFSSCGKSTLAKALAKELGYTFIDSGAMYRGVTLFALRNKLIDNNTVRAKELINALDHIHITFESVPNADKKHLFLNGEDVESEIRNMEVAQHVSAIAAIKEVRLKLVTLQREMGKNGGVVMDGRDIGSVVFPDADLKFFITASPDIRAQRRYLELSSQGKNVTLEEVEENLLERDRIDTTRDESPLIQVDDAIFLDNSNLSPKEQLEFALSKVKELV